MHFSLRTLLVIVTAVAVYVGFHLGMFRTFSPRRSLDVVVFIAMLYRLPLFIIWSIACSMVFNRRVALRRANLVIAAILLAATWMMLFPFAQTTLFHLPSFNQNNLVDRRWYGAALSILDGAVEAASWGLMLYAYLETSRGPALPSGAEQHPIA
jgi:hypothetical protein